MYAKINENGLIEIYRKPYVKIGKSLIANPTDKIMARAGYKPLKEAALPELSPGESLKLDYRDDGNFISEVYEIIGGKNDSLKV